jgi:hypothetical protein
VIEILTGFIELPAQQLGDQRGGRNFRFQPRVFQRHFNIFRLVYGSPRGTVAGTGRRRVDRWEDAVEFGGIDRIVAGIAAARRNPSGLDGAVDGALAESGGAGGRAEGVAHGVAPRFMERPMKRATQIVNGALTMPTVTSSRGRLPQPPGPSVAKNRTKRLKTMDAGGRPAEQVVEHHRDPDAIVCNSRNWIRSFNKERAISAQRPKPRGGCSHDQSHKFVDRTQLCGSDVVGCLKSGLGQDQNE